MATVKPARGEIWWCEEPDVKRRPVLILTRDEAIKVLDSVLTVPSTTKVRDIPTHVPLDETDGMPYPCALALDNVTSMLKAYLIKRVTKLGPAKTAEVCNALNVAVSCSNERDG